VKKILVVDDSRLVLRFEELCLRGRYEVSTAENANEALAKALEERPDLVITDLNLPDRSGSEIASALGSDPRTCGIKVIVVSTASELKRLQEPHPCLEKPFDRDALLAKISQTLH
jgi:twitching motility two-component system response regulator PilH